MTGAVPPARDIGVGVIGGGWMGHAHARAYARLPHHYPDLGLRPRLAAVAEPLAAKREDFAARFAPARAYSDWRELLADPDVAAVSVTVPNALHREVGTAVAAAGRHLWIEKPVGLTAEDARAVAAAADRAGIQATTGFNYRQVPAVARAARLLREGAIGTPAHARVRLFTDYAAHPGTPLSWRFTREHGGDGVLGDLASHGVDLVRFLLGEVAAVVADTAVLVPRRPGAAEGAGHYAIAGTGDGGALGDVENEDYVAALLRTAGGARVVLEASRVAAGQQNAYGVTVHGERGMLSWDFRRPGELVVSSGGDYLNQPLTTALAGPGDGDYARFQPGPGIAMSFDDTKVAEAAVFLRGVRDGRSGGATLTDAARAAEVLQAMAESARTGTWVAPDGGEGGGGS